MQAVADAANRLADGIGRIKVPSENVEIAATRPAT